MVSGDDFSDLLIFKGRNIKPETTPKKEEAQTQPKVEQKMTKPSAPAQIQVQQAKMQPPQKQKVKEKVPESMDIKKLTCINHPWRGAYAFCASDNLPYCFVDLIEYGGKTYCLNDIDYALRKGNEVKIPPARNSFSILSSILLLANIAIIVYFTKSELQFVISLMFTQGLQSFFTNFNYLYLFPIANVLVLIFGIFTILSITRNSLYLFGLAFVLTFGSAFIMGYQYFSNSTIYSLASSVLLLVAVSTLVYSRMSSVTLNAEKTLSPPEIDWPKPEVF